jgi:hypothetical protein
LKRLIIAGRRRKASDKPGKTGNHSHAICCRLVC